MSPSTAPPIARSRAIALAGGALLILAGYVALAAAPADSALSATVAPCLLVAGYCAAIPLAVLSRGSGSDPG